MTKRLGLTIWVAFVIALFFTANINTPSPVIPSASLAPQPAANSIAAGQVEPILRRLDYRDPASWSQQIHHPQAVFIKLHVNGFELRPGDYLTVSSPDGTESYQYPATQQPSSPDQPFWVLSISGDTAIIQLHLAARLDRPVGYQGVTLDRYAWGYPRDNAQPDLFSQEVCGQNERVDVSCYEGSHPSEFSRVAPVARMVMPLGVGAFPSCTAWRIGPNNHMIANEHCIANQTQLEAAEFWFNYQRPACGSGDPGPVVKVAGDELLA
ncbi:MAG: hypothetical protein R3264_01140, partial [Anaerolineae bacterium]|nr:hypothetical protein [Anaerolineae bacterium]